eukprot:12891188-Prorocentrum_lima.AAC.1
MATMRGRKAHCNCSSMRTRVSCGAASKPMVPLSAPPLRVSPGASSGVTPHSCSRSMSAVLCRCSCAVLGRRSGEAQ